MKILYRQKLKVGFGIALLLLLGVALISYINLKNLIRNAQWIDHTNLILRNLESISTITTEAQLAYLKFLSSNDKKHIKILNSAHSKVSITCDRIKNLTEDNANQQNKLDSLKILIEKNFTVIESSVNAGRPFPESLIPEKASDSIYNNLIFNTARIIDQLKAEELKLLQVRTAKADYSKTLTPAVLILTSLLAIIIALLSFFLIDQENKKIAEAEDLLQGIMDSSVSGTMAFNAVKDKSGKTIEFINVLVNTTTEKLLNTTSGQIRGKKMTELFPHVIENGFLDKYIHLYEHGGIIDIENYSLSTKKWIHTIAVKINNGIAITFNDISSRKLTEEKLKEDQYFITHITNSIPEIIYVYDLNEKRNVYLNHRINLILGYNIEQIQNMSSAFMDIIVHPDDRNQLNNTLLEISESTGKEVFEIEYRVRHVAGNWIKLFVKIVVFKTDHTGKPLQILGIAEDITKRNSDQLLLSGVLNSSQTGIMGLKAEFVDDRIIDFEWKLINKSAEKLVNRRDLLGKKLLEEMPGNKTSGLFDLYAKVVLTGEPADVEQYYNHDGFQTWFRIVTVKWQDGIVVNFENITDRKLNEEEIRIKNQDLLNTKDQLKKYNEELEKKIEERTMEVVKKNNELILINKDLDNFIYTASHDLKAPLNNIEGLVSSLVEDITTEYSQELISMINQSIQRFKDTIQELSETAKTQSESNLPHEPIILPELISEIKLTIAPMINASKATIFEDFSGAPTIYFSKKNLRSILYNLVSNAIKYSSPERSPEIYIKSIQSNEYIVLEVADNGLGIPEEDFGKVFTMYYRVHHHVEGTGLGLGLVKKIVDNAGGRIELESKVNEGSKFRIFFKIK